MMQKPVREGISETTEDLRALKVEVTSLKEILSTKDAEVEKLKRWIFKIFL